MRRNLQHIKLDNPNTLFANPDVSDIKFETLEGISIKSNYAKTDLEDLEHLDFAAGFTPYLRGSRTTMYVREPWSIRQLDRFLTVQDANYFFKKQLDAGQKNFTIAFDLPTQQENDSDQEPVFSEVGKAGFALDTVEDMKKLFDQIPLQEITVSFLMNGSVLPILAFYIVAAEEQGVQPEQLKGTIQNDILKDCMVQKTASYSLQFSMKITASILEFTQKRMPEFNPISVLGNAIQESDAPADIELAYALANGLEYCRTALSMGIQFDDFAPRLSFYFGIGMNHFMEIAKLRAARMIWAKLVQEFNPQNTQSQVLQIHCQNRTIQDSYHAVAQTCIEAAAAVFGGTQSLLIHSIDKSNGLSPDLLARNTQLYLQKETKITKTVDPWGGSYYVESLTHELVQSAFKHLEEIEKLGGMTKAIETGIPALRIQEAAVRKQARIDEEVDIKIDLNPNQLENKDSIRAPEADNFELCQQQLEQIKQIKADRNKDKVHESLSKLTLCATTSEGNLLELALDAGRNRATLREINAALEKGFGRYEPK